MTTQTHVGTRVTFKELFERDQHGRVQIPIIQRDYAQGRESQVEIRSSFIEALFDALSKSQRDRTLPLDLDFVYGSIEGADALTFSPLDGQQRLTTLFLLHWYLAWLDAKSDEFRSFITKDRKSRFSYSVRPSSDEFFNELTHWIPPSDWEEKYVSIGSVVADQPWFFQWWKRDPTISSALIMLDAIHKRFKETKGFYDRIVQTEYPFITFQLLDLANFGLSDDLYIKMNARGKPLTSFEVLKARLEPHVENAFFGQTENLNGHEVSMRDYFSHQIDTVWADLFWDYRDYQGLFDDEVMNLIGALAVVTRTPDDPGFEKTVAELRNGTSVSYHRFVDLGCLDNEHVGVLVSLLDHFSNGSGGVRKYLPDDGAYNEGVAFKRILDQGVDASYRALLQFYAYAAYVRLHSAPLSVSSFDEWMRVIVNLTNNSLLERPEEFRTGLRSINRLLSEAADILKYFASADAKIDGFNMQQIQEERVKAALILKDANWRNLILAAEVHGYFNGQIEFLLDFCGGLEAWKTDNSCSWDSDQDSELQAKFKEYFEKAIKIFDEKGLKFTKDLLTERALLSLGDYTFSKGQNLSFLENPHDGPLSWKRLLRGEQINQPGHGRGLLKDLLDKLDLETDILGSLQTVIDSASPEEEWRARIARNPALIKYCEKRQLRYINPMSIYLLKGLRRSGEHVELYSFDFYTARLLKKLEKAKLGSFLSSQYNPQFTDWLEPTITLRFKLNKKQLDVSLWHYDTNILRFEISSKDKPLLEVLQKNLKGSEEKGKVIVDTIFDFRRAEKILDKMIASLRPYMQA